MEQSTSYDDAKQYKLEPKREAELAQSAGEWVLIRANKAGHPLGVINTLVPVGSGIWMTATHERVHIEAIARDGRSSYLFTGKGTPMGGDKTVTCRDHR